MLAPLREASGKTAYRFIVSRSDSAYGCGELSVGRSVDPRELLKLGIAISERTVSRYLRGRPPTWSQTWRTFFANRVGDRTFISPVIFADASGDDIVVDAFDVSFRPAQLSINGSCVSAQWAVDYGLPFQSRFLGMPLRQDQLQDRPGACKSTGRDPPPHPWLQRWRPAAGSFRVCLQYLCDRRHREAMLQHESKIGRAEFPS